MFHNKNWDSKTIVSPDSNTTVAEVPEDVWAVRYRSDGTFDENFCSNTGSGSAEGDVWMISENYFDKKSNKLYLDVNRTISFDEDNTFGA